MRDSPHSCFYGGKRWPVVAGIPYLRTGREALREAVLSDLDAGNERMALARLLGDQDDFARIPPPSLAALLVLIDDKPSFGETLKRLNFGPVADYFRFRPWTPTYLSGLGLLAQFGAPAGGVVIEIACGVGHFLAEIRRSGYDAIGVDTVFSKLWLARRFVAREADLFCADATGRLPIATGTPATVLCHDAFYFLSDKAAALAEMHRLATPAGTVLIGHTHNRDVESGVAGDALTPCAYAALHPGAMLFDDEDFIGVALGTSTATEKSPDTLARAEAVSLAWVNGARASAVAPWHELLQISPDANVWNPLLTNWPSESFRKEYESHMDYLFNMPALTGGSGQEVDLDLNLAQVAASMSAKEFGPLLARLRRQRIRVAVPTWW